MAKNAKEIKEQESKLLTYLRDDTKLDKDTKMQYISMANMFLDNFDKYLHLTSIEMNKEIPFPKVFETTEMDRDSLYRTDQPAENPLFLYTR